MGGKSTFAAHGFSRRAVLTASGRWGDRAPTLTATTEPKEAMSMRLINLVVSLSFPIFLVLADQPVAADDDTETATAEISGCTDPNISGTAELREQRSDEGVKQ